MISIISLLSNAVAKGIAVMFLVGFLRRTQGMRVHKRHHLYSGGREGAWDRSLPQDYDTRWFVRSRAHYASSTISSTTDGECVIHNGCGGGKASTSSSSSGGTITARILPKDRIDYETKKPNARNLDVEFWRERVKHPSAEEAAAAAITSDASLSSTNIDLQLNNSAIEWTVSLDVNLHTSMILNPMGHGGTTRNTKTNTKEHPIQVHFHMHRLAAETVERTLKRLFLSTCRKIVDAQNSIIQSSGSFVRGDKLVDRNSISSSSNDSERSSSSSLSSSGPLNERLDTSIWVPVDEIKKSHVRDATTSKQPIPKEETTCYRQFQVDPEMESSQLWANLAEHNPSRSGSSIITLNLQHINKKGTRPPLVSSADNIPLQVESFPPTIVSVQTFEEFQADLFVGVPLCIQTEVLHATRARIVWFVDGHQVLYDSAVYTPVSNDVGKQVSVLITPLRSNSTSDTLSAIDDGGGGCYDEVYYFERKVQARPFLPIVHERKTWLNENPKRMKEGDAASSSASQYRGRSSHDCPRRLRVMSYNLLADLYASRGMVDENQRLTYHHCDLEFLSKRRRFPLLLYEILAYDPDIVCLQEVDATIFDQLLRPVLMSQGYRGFYSNKVGAQLEGCATFWSTQCFEEEAIQQEFPLRDLLGNTQPQSGTWDPIQRLLDHHPELQSVMGEKVGQILQVATLCLKNNDDRTSIARQQKVAEKIVVGNTHLFYHPMADHVRAIQAYTVCQQLDKIRRLSDGQSPSPFILCGDLNSDPLSGAMRLLLHGQVESDHFETWKNLHSYTWNKGEQEYMLDHGYVGTDVNSDPTYVDEAFEDAQQDQDDTAIESLETAGGLIVPPCIKLPEGIPPLISGYPELPEFTNYATDFSETLDYILASGPDSYQGFGFEQVLDSAAPCLTSNQMKEYIAMPNEFMPSDHVSLVCDLQWKRSEKQTQPPET